LAPPEPNSTLEELSGEVVKGPFAVGSKSEHQAIYLMSSRGRYVLRRQGGNPFHDSALDKLVGKNIRGRGVITGYTFLVTDWTELG
jgi:hypothetical protein